MLVELPALLGLLPLLACSAPRLVDRPLEPFSTSASPPAPALTQRAEVATREAAADAELRRLLARVSALRGLPPPPVLELRTLPAAELAQAALAQAAQDWPEPARRARALLLWRLGLLPAGSDLLVLITPALEGLLEAFYARPQGVPTLFVARALTGRARTRALAHELVHALQDHEHSLLRRLADEAEGSDRRSALHALAEADALAVVERLGLAAEEVAARPPDVPAVLLRSLEAPYLDGRELLTEALAEGGFGAVDRWLRAPPVSTHALLHPRASDEPAAPLPEPPAPGAGWQRSYGDVLGEQSLRVLLEEADPVRAADLAAGWRADRFSVFQSGEQGALLWELELASEEAAVGFEPLFHRGILQRERGAWGEPALQGAEWTCGAHSDTGVVATAHRERHWVFGSLTPGSQIVTAAAQCASLQEWIGRVRFHPRPGYAKPHRSIHTPPNSRSEAGQ